MAQGVNIKMATPAMMLTVLGLLLSMGLASESLTLDTHPKPDGRSTHAAHMPTRSSFSSERTSEPQSERQAMASGVSRMAVDDDDDDDERLLLESRVVVAGDKQDGDPTKETLSSLLSVSDREDIYNCSASTQCFCFPLDHGRYAAADCTALKLYDIPLDLPHIILRLTMDSNRMQSLNLSSLLNYPKLKIFDAHGNNISSIIQPSTLPSNPTLQVLFLDSNKLQAIDDFSFKTLSSLKILDLKENLIQSVSNNTLAGLGNLLKLDLSWNKIRRIAAGAFDSVPKLMVLRLNNNFDLTYTPSHFPPRLFVNLKSLKRLAIEGNSDGSAKYPNEALGFLTNLTTLSMDGLGNDAILGPPLKQLERLVSLKIGVGNKTACIMRNLTSSFFENVPRLENLELSKCLVSNISSDAFVNLPNLERLKMSYSRNLGINDALGSLASLQNSSLKKLILIHIKRHYSRPCRYVEAESARFIKNINLELLDLSENDLAMIAGNFYKALPQTLKTFVLKDNIFSPHTFALPMVAGLQNLETLDLTSQNIGEMKPSPWKSAENFDCTSNECTKGDYPTARLDEDGSMWDHETEAEPPLHIVMSRNNIISGTPLTKDKTEQNDSQTTYEPSTPVTDVVQRSSFPPNLKTLLAPEFTYFGDLILYRKYKNNKFEVLDFSHSFLSEWGTGLMPNKVTRLSLEGNYCRWIRRFFFQWQNSLTFLNVRDNILGPQFASDEQGKTFQLLWKLVVLDMSMNLIYKLPPHVFKGLKSLRVLFLSDNKLQSLNLSVSHMKDLEKIDASRNSIAWISKEMRDQLDLIALNHRVSIDLRKNPLPCTCPGIEILVWLATSNVHLIGEDFLVCRFDNNEYDSIGNLSQRVLYMKRKCTPVLDIILISVCCAVLFLIICTLLLLYRTRWKLIYLYKVKIAKWFGFQPRTQTTRRKFDAHILYAEEDRDFVLGTMLTELEEKRGHKLCVADRDYMPGTFTTTNLVCAAQSSTWTIPVISPDFINDDYSEYGVQMAVCESIYKKRPVLYLLLFPETDHSTLFKDLLALLRDDKYTELPPLVQLADENIKQNFWDNLSQMIGHSQSQCRPRLDLSDEVM